MAGRKQAFMMCFVSIFDQQKHYSSRLILLLGHSVTGHMKVAVNSKTVFILGKF